jgi:hypothetical protein
MPEGLRICVIRVSADTQMIETLETEVKTFLADLDKMVNELNELRA